MHFLKIIWISFKRGEIISPFYFIVCKTSNLNQFGCSLDHHDIKQNLLATSLVERATVHNFFKS